MFSDDPTAPDKELSDEEEREFVEFLIKPIESFEHVTGQNFEAEEGEEEGVDEMTEGLWAEIEEERSELERVEAEENEERGMEIEEGIEGMNIRHRDLNDEEEIEEEDEEEEEEEEDKENEEDEDERRITPGIEEDEDEEEEEEEEIIDLPDFPQWEEDEEKQLIEEEEEEEEERAEEEQDGLEEEIEEEDEGDLEEEEEEEIEVEVEEEETKQEEQERLRQECLNKMETIEKEFTQLKDSFFQELSQSLSQELQQLKNGTHAKYVESVSDLEEKKRMRLWEAKGRKEKALSSLDLSFQAECYQIDEEMNDQCQALRRELMYPLTRELSGVFRIQSFFPVYTTPFMTKVANGDIPSEETYHSVLLLKESEIEEDLVLIRAR